MLCESIDKPIIRTDGVLNVEVVDGVKKSLLPPRTVVLWPNGAGVVRRGWVRGDEEEEEEEEGGWDDKPLEDKESLWYVTTFI